MIRDRKPQNIDYARVAHPELYWDEWQWTPTMEFRWKAGKLQQKWHGANAHQYEDEWRLIEEVPDDAPDKP